MFGAVLAGSLGQERPASEPPARELERKAAQTRESWKSETITSVTDKSRQQERALRGPIYNLRVRAFCYANGRTTNRHVNSTLMPFPIYSERKRGHASRDKVQSEVYDVVTDIRPRLVAPHPRETRQTSSSRITSSARILSHRLCWCSAGYRSEGNMKQ